MGTSIGLVIANDKHHARIMDNVALYGLAGRIAQNAPLTNYALMHALPRIAEQPADQGFFTFNFQVHGSAR
jgi:hypothetical protein